LSVIDDAQQTQIAILGRAQGLSQQECRSILGVDDDGIDLNTQFVAGIRGEMIDVLHGKIELDLEISAIVSLQQSGVLEDPDCGGLS
jgi:hypothetical protein